MLGKELRNLLLWALGYYKDPKVEVPSDFVYPNPKQPLDQTKPKVTWLGHSTFLVEVFGIRFLTDPVWSQKLSPVGPKRRKKAPISIADLPPIDYILISHNHYDHLDKKAQKLLAELNPSLQWFVPKGVKPWFRRHLKKDKEVVEVEWGDSCVDHRKEGVLSFTSTFAKHFSGRTLWDRNKTLWMGIIVEIRTVHEVKRFYFAGDTAYDPTEFQEIGKKWKKLDLALLPIGAYSPRQFMSSVHVDPQEAVQIHKDVNSILSVGGHHGTYKLTSEQMHQPPFELYQSLEKEGISYSTFRVLEPGQTINW